MIQISDRFPRYTEFDPLVPVYCVTPGEGRVIHRFFDTPPFSPSGRYMALLRLPQEERVPEPGEEAQVVLVDLVKGEERVVATTRGWEPQMGANINWGPDDETLLFNDVDTSDWSAFCVRLNPLTGESVRLGGTIYRATSDGTRFASATIPAMRRTQSGYGVRIPDELTPRNIGLRDDVGLYVTDTATGDCRMIVSLKDCVEQATPRSDLLDLDGYEFYGFHCKWNPQCDRILFTMRAFPVDAPYRFDALHQPDKQVRYNVFTMNNDGGDIRTAVPASEWVKGGHHINWQPDGRTLSMNLNIDRDVMRFVEAGYDGSNLRKMLDDVVGSGHPTVHPNGRHIVTDAYVHESLAFGDGTTPIRLVDRETHEVRDIIRIQTASPHQKTHSCLRIDPHPAWDSDNEWIAFNAFVGGTRRVYVADMRGVVG